MAKSDATPPESEDHEPAEKEAYRSGGMNSGQVPITAIQRAIQSTLGLQGPRLGAQVSAALAEVNAETIANTASALALLKQHQERDLSRSLDAMSALLRYAAHTPPLTNPKNYASLDTPVSTYSAEMKSPRSYFERTEGVIGSFDDLHSAITTLIANTPEISLVWRGAKNADWGLHSHLYRRLLEVNGVAPPSSQPQGVQRYPDEDQMVAAEKEILRIARTDWRFDHLSALEIFARIQHAGGPTRLIDVTKNPYIAAWFAVEYDTKEEQSDARLFALATKPVSREGKPPPPDSTLQLDGLGASRDPFWHLLANSEERQEVDWGTGARRRIWVPPAYDPRISAQNAAFILDGVPMTSSKTASHFKIRKGQNWRRADLLAASSIYARMRKANQKPKYNSGNFAPTFSFRIEAGAKSDIREVMEARFGYRLSYIYPDVAALADYLKTCRLDGSDS